MSLVVIMAILLIIQTAFLIWRRWEVRTLKRLHQHDLATTRNQWYEFGWKDARSSLPLVQHCNSRTNYEFIKHRYDPENCKHCDEIQELLNET